MDLSIVIPQAQNTAEIERLLAQLPGAVSRLPGGVEWEVIVAQRAGASQSMADAVARAGGRFLPDAGDYGAALRAAVDASGGDYVLTMEPGLAHSPYIIPELYARRDEADLLVASRHMDTGYSQMNLARRILSTAGNAFFSLVLDLPVRDFTSSFRLYRRRIFSEVHPQSRGLGVLLELLVRAHMAGFRMEEVPFHYYPTDPGANDTFMRLGKECLTELFRLWRLRNSIDCSDYDERAFRSRIWFQRSWQRKRYHALVRMARDCERVLDVGCGSSQVLDGLPQADGCDVRLNKLRHKRGRSRALVRASVFDLPFHSNYYDAVIFSQVIEHLSRDPKILSEIVRCARPGGYVIVGTPDYATWWTTIEKVYGFVQPDGYADEHITHYTYDSLKAEVEALGCTLIDHAYVYRAELIMRFRKDGERA